MNEKHYDNEGMLAKQSEALRAPQFVYQQLRYGFINSYRDNIKLMKQSQ